MKTEAAIHCVNLVPIFKTLPLSEKTAVAKLIVQHQYPKGTIIYLAGDHVGHFLILERGQIKISQIAENGKEQLLKVMQPGEFDGEAALFNGEQRQVTATALVDTTVCQIDQDAFQRLLQQSPQLAVNLLTTMSHQIGELQEARTIAATTDVPGQLAKYLLETSAALHTSTFKLPLKKKDIATFLGTTPETVSRVLKQMVADTLIEMKAATITIKDADRLTTMV